MQKNITLETMEKHLQNKINLYQMAVIFSVLFALVGFTYNVWRMEVSEENNTIRTACFEMLLELAALEQLIYTAHYDGNIVEGSPRKGWVKIGLIADLSLLTADSIRDTATALKNVWTQHWNSMVDNTDSVTQIVQAIDTVRESIKLELKMLD